MGEDLLQMFADYPKTVKLRDEQPIVVRQMVKTDEKELLEFFKSITLEDYHYLKEDVTNPEVIHRWADNLDYEHVVPILAIDDGKIVGDATLHRNRFGWSQHVGEIRIVTHPAYRRKGLGSLLAREIFFLALKLKLDKVVAQMMEEQQSAMHVFSRLGFHQEALLKDHVTDIKGKKHNLIIMSQSIVDFWRRIQDLFEESVKIHSGA
ncbi:MAG: N-acetyltransferase [Candidatus Omnitrophota bacterium]|jgi:RimJ/RimL family protein N-acetyltransferase|nr:MAG: N-acetyltransferase [Candidatus Omnitrophota bacterium]